MSGETRSQVSGWTVDTLKEYCDDKFIAQEKAVAAALNASDKATGIAEANAEKWRANANEWRSAMTDRERKFASREDLQALKERMDRSDGKGQGLATMWGLVVGGIGLISALVVIFLAFR